MAGWSNAFLRKSPVIFTGQNDVGTVLMISYVKTMLVFECLVVKKVE